MHARGVELLTYATPEGVDAVNLEMLLGQLHALGAGLLSVGTYSRRGVTQDRSWWAQTSVPVPGDRYRPIGVGNHIGLVRAVDALVRMAVREVER